MRISISSTGNIELKLYNGNNAFVEWKFIIFALISSKLSNTIELMSIQSNQSFGKMWNGG
jgi:hypothetical protein